MSTATTFLPPYTKSIWVVSIGRGSSNSAATEYVMGTPDRSSLTSFSWRNGGKPKSLEASPEAGGVSRITGGR